MGKAFPSRLLRAPLPHQAGIPRNAPAPRQLPPRVQLPSSAFRSSPQPHDCCQAQAGASLHLSAKPSGCPQNAPRRKVLRHYMAGAAWQLMPASKPSRSSSRSKGSMLSPRGLQTPPGFPLIKPQNELLPGTLHFAPASPVKAHSVMILAVFPGLLTLPRSSFAPAL